MSRIVYVEYYRGHYFSETSSVLFVTGGYLSDDRGAITLTSSEAITLTGSPRNGTHQCQNTPKHLPHPIETGEPFFKYSDLKMFWSVSWPECLSNQKEIE